MSAGSSPPLRVYGKRISHECSQKLKGRCIVLTGEQRAWELLAAASPDDVCQRAKVTVGPVPGSYVVPSLGQHLTVIPDEQAIRGDTPLAEYLLGRLGYFSRLTILWHLVRATDVPPAGRLVMPAELKVGQTFYRGSHVLPLPRLATRYDGDRAGFLARAHELGGEPQDHGDVSAVLFPVPEMTVAVIQWMSDDEFPARADVLLDANCEMKLPPDVVWSAAMVCVLAMSG